MKKLIVTTAIVLILMATHAGATITAPSGKSTPTTSTTRMKSIVKTAAPLIMDNNEFSNFTVSRWDTDGDGHISNLEWDRSASSWFGANNEQKKTFSIWDTNADGMLDATEMKMVGVSGLFKRYDTNGDRKIDRNESARIPQ